jgi:hypothetical protein
MRVTAAKVREGTDGVIGEDHSDLGLDYSILRHCGIEARKRSRERSDHFESSLVDTVD